MGAWLTGTKKRLDVHEQSVNSAAVASAWGHHRPSPGASVCGGGRRASAAVRAYAVLTMTRRHHVPALASSVLAVVAPEADAADVDARLAAAGATLHAGVAEALLDELARLGLVRVTRGSASRRRFVLTSLGQQALRDSLASGSADQLAELESLRTDLLSTIAHELRTPLTAVRTSVGLLLERDSEPTEEQRRTLLAAIERNAERMQRVVGDILDLTRFRAGSIRLQLRRFDPLELALGAQGSLAPLARELDATIRVEGGRHQPPVYGDRRRLEQALVNLVSNAVHHAPPDGQVTVGVTASARETRWAVRDHGPGIPHEERPRLFERFFVGRSDRHSVHEGAGLGLPTALAIAQAHGGTIEVESEPGQGSTFTLVVPTDGPEDPE
jgi:signal transduction histidine kinase